MSKATNGWPYLPLTAEQRTEMLKAIGITDVNALFSNIPDQLKLTQELSLPRPLDEYGLKRKLTSLAGENKPTTKYLSFLGGGIYDHIVPAAVEHLAGRGEFYTAYTPYQAEASQGILQAFFEYQTLVCQLTGMDVANASLYDGATALAEAVFVALATRKKRGKILISQTTNPQYLQVLRTYTRGTELAVKEIPWHKGIADVAGLEAELSEQVAAVAVQHPNFLGALEDMEQISDLCHKFGTLLIVIIDPISLGLLKPPADYGADIVVGEGQCLGCHQYYGGETLGMFACRQELLRLVPGRLVGMTQDIEGNRGFVLTLQTREQHIRRERATSNICTNNALNALRAAIYLASLGPQGIKQIAENCLKKAHYLKQQMASLPQFSLPFSAPTFKEFVVKYEGNAAWLLHELVARGIFGGINLGQLYQELQNHILICVTEKRTKEELDFYIKTIKEITNIG